MVQVRDHHPLQDNGVIDIEHWVSGLIDRAATNNTLDKEVLISACELARASEANTDDQNHQT